MPPIPPPQGSRAALITSLVIFVILFVTSTVMLFHFQSLAEANEKSKKEYTDRIHPYITDADQTAPEVVALKGDAAISHVSAIQLALQQRDELAKQLTGVVPTEKFDPLGGTHTVVAPGQLSVGAGIE